MQIVCLRIALFAQRIMPQYHVGAALQQRKIVFQESPLEESTTQTKQVRIDFDRRGGLFLRDDDRLWTRSGPAWCGPGLGSKCWRRGSGDGISRCPSQRRDQLP